MTGDATMRGKTCVVTGATGGIGKVTARELARRGARVVIIGRNPEKLRTAVDDIRTATGSDSVESLQADLESQAEVRGVASEIRGRCERLDVLVDNVGAAFGQKQLTVDGIERTFALNHLTPFLLTNLLLDRLEASGPARVVVVSSEAHRGFVPRSGRPDLADLADPARYHPGRAYAHSKLANILFARELARRLEGRPVTVNALHPGFVNSDFFEGFGALGWVIRRVADVFAISAEQGARTSLYLATSPDVAGTSGGYFIKEKPATPSKPAQDAELARELWDLSLRLTGLDGAGSGPGAVDAAARPVTGT